VEKLGHLLGPTFSITLGRQGIGTSTGAMGAEARRVITRSPGGHSIAIGIVGWDVDRVGNLVSLVVVVGVGVGLPGRGAGALRKEAGRMGGWELEQGRGGRTSVRSALLCQLLMR
jgi:hypothetical protein